METAEKAKSELRSLLMTHLSLLEKGEGAAPELFNNGSVVPAPTEA
jgi:hypothetical protein